jgi:hypothetical protein
MRKPLLSKSIDAFAEAAGGKIESFVPGKACSGDAATEQIKTVAATPAVDEE